MAASKTPPAPPAPPHVTQSDVPLLGESTLLRRNSSARPVPGILGATVLKIYGLVGEEIAGPDLRKSSDMDDAALGAALAELVERGLVIAEVVKSEDPLDLDFTSPEVLEKLRVEADQVKQAEEDARRRVEAERKAKLQAEAKVRSEAEAKARADADAKANLAALARLKAEKVARTQSDSEINARQGALDRAENEARMRADALARAEAEARVRADSVRKAEAEAALRLAAVRRMEAELKGKMAALARLDSERKQKAENERRAREEAESRAASERRAREQAEASAEEERRARLQAEEKAQAEARTLALAERRAREEAEARADQERRAREAAEARATQERTAREAAAEAARQDALALAEKERKARLEAEARAEQERAAREAAAEAARQEALAIAEKERRARVEAEARAQADRQAAEQAAAAVRAEATALAEKERRARTEAEAKAEAERLAREAAERLASEERRVREQVAEQARAEALALAESERRAREAAEQRAEVERQLREQAEANAAAQVEAKASAEERARQDALALAREAQATQERLRAEASERALAERAAREEAQAERRAREQAEAMVATERSAREEVERRAREQADAERRARAQAQALVEAERLLREEAEARMHALSSTERKAREKTEAQLKSQIEALTAAEKQARQDAQAAGDARRAAEARAAAEVQSQPLAGLQPATRPAAPSVSPAAAAPATAGQAGSFEEMLSAATLFGASDDAAASPAPAQASLDNLSPRRSATTTAPAAQAVAQPPAADPSLVVDADVLARATREAVEDAEAQSRIEQERFTRELEEQMARVNAEQAPVPVSPATGKPFTPDEEIQAIREKEARDRAEEFARQQMADILKIEEKRAKEEEQRRMLGEEEAKRRAREAAEIASRARAEREKFERERERQRKLAEAEAQALARAKTRAEQPPESRWKLYTGGAVLLVAGIIGLFEVLPFNFYLSRVEQAMSNALGERVVVKSMHASLIPRPNIRLTEVTVGTSGSGATVAAVHAVPTVLSLFWGPLTFRSVLLDTVTVSQEFIPKLPDVVAMDGKETLGFERISIRNLRLALPNLDVPPAEVEIAWNGDGTFNRANILAYSRRVAIDLTRTSDEVAFRMSATNWQPLPGNTATIDQMKANGTATRNGLVASEVDADLYGGKAQGSFTVAWGPDTPNATASGEFLLRRLDVAKLLPAMTANASATGLMDGNMKFSLQAPTLRRLLDAPQVSTAFTVRRGWLGGIDVVRLLRDSTNRGGRTVFDEWTGVFAVAGSSYSLRQMRLTSGPMTATGAADIDADSVLTGRIDAQLSTGSGTAVRSNFGLGGTLQNIEVGN